MPINRTKNPRIGGLAPFDPSITQKLRAEYYIRQLDNELRRVTGKGLVAHLKRIKHENRERAARARRKTGGIPPARVEPTARAGKQPLGRKST